MLTHDDVMARVKEGGVWSEVEVEQRGTRIEGEWYIHSNVPEYVCFINKEYHPGAGVVQVHHDWVHLIDGCEIVTRNSVEREPQMPGVYGLTSKNN